MSVIDRHGDTAQQLKKYPRYLAPKEEAFAKQQAYIFRDLVELHCHLKLPKQDALDTYSLLFHGMPWTDLMANKRGEPQSLYYGLKTRPLIGLLSRNLKDLLPDLAGPSVRVLCDMPAERYRDARTLAGARLATAISGQPAWSLPDIGVSEVTTSLQVEDRRSGGKGFVLWFNSDPMSNEERVAVLDPGQNKIRYIPAIDVGYEAPGVDFSEVKDPSERWSPQFRNMKDLLPRLQAAAAEYDDSLARIDEVPSDTVETYLGDATEAYNEVLKEGIEAYWKDTREINSREQLYRAYGVANPREALCFTAQNPLQKVRQMIGAD